MVVPTRKFTRMADAVIEQWRPEGEEGSDAGLKDSATSDVFPSNGIASIVSPKELDKNEGHYLCL